MKIPSEEMRVTCPICKVEVTQELECMSREVNVFSHSCGCVSTHTYPHTEWKSKDEEATVVISNDKFPAIKGAVELAYFCGLTTVDEAINNWDRSLMHGSHAKIPERTRTMSDELEMALRLVGTDLWEMELWEVSLALGLDLDFEALDKELESMNGGYGDV